jgi:hypothetical protein
MMRKRKKRIIMISNQRNKIQIPTKNQMKRKKLSKEEKQYLLIKNPKKKFLVESW